MGVYLWNTYIPGYNVFEIKSFDLIYLLFFFFFIIFFLRLQLQFCFVLLFRLYL